MNHSHLFLFSIGPVQSFIAAARRTQDLYVGSRLLSLIAQSGVEAAMSGNAELLFPVAVDGKLPQSIPHRFAFISDGDPKTIADGIVTAMLDKWDSMAHWVGDWLYDKISGGEWQDVFVRQVGQWLEINWVAVSYGIQSHDVAYREANQALAARKQARHFPHVFEPGQKCTLTGAQSALPINWQQLKKAIRDPRDIQLRSNERLGAIAAIKRFIQFEPQNPLNEDVTHFRDITTIAGGKEEDDEPHYLAVLHMDGDRMGKRLSALKSLDEHQEFSRKLGEFATHVYTTFIDQDKYYPGALVYAGGDDVLALLPLEKALTCAIDLRDKFGEIVGEYTDPDTGERICASAGISITPHNLPLDGALEQARLSEKRAKDYYGRDAIVVREPHRSGQIREAGGKWDVTPAIETIQDHIATDQLSGKLGFDCLALAHDLEGGTVPAAAIQSEAKRILHRRIKAGTPTSVKNDLETQMNILSNFAQTSQGGWKSVAHWVILARFMAKEGQTA